jgi:hypothetical protein
MPQRSLWRPGDLPGDFNPAPRILQKIPNPQPQHLRSSPFKISRPSPRRGCGASSLRRGPGAGIRHWFRNQFVEDADLCGSPDRLSPVVKALSESAAARVSRRRTILGVCLGMRKPQPLHAPPL